MKKVSIIFWIIAIIVSLWFGSHDSMAFNIVIIGFGLVYLGAIVIYGIIRLL